MNPDVHYASKREDPVNSFVPAGVSSDRMVELMRCDFGDAVKAPSPFCQFQTANPISHNQLPDEDVADTGTALRGRAGVTTDRLTLMTTSWILEHDEQNKETNPRFKKTDHISHVGGPGPPEPGKGIRRFKEKTASHTKLNHSAIAPAELAPEAVHDLLKTKIVNMGGGQVIVNIAGGEDMIPPATHTYMKSDRPVSAAYRAENERRFLPGFFRWREQQRQSPTLGESEDMYYAMYGDRAPLAMYKAQDFPDDDEDSPAMQSGLRSASVDRFAGSTGSLTERAAWDGRRTARSSSMDRLALYAGFPTGRDLSERRTARSASFNSGSPARAGSPARSPAVMRRSASLNSGSAARSPAKPYQRNLLTYREPGSRQRLPAPPEWSI